MTARPRVSIIYLSYNTEAYIQDVADSVAAQTYPHAQLEYIVVDNASSDASVERIREYVLPKSGKELPSVTFLPSAENLGFAQGNNVGIEHAMVGGADYVYLLNGDAKLAPTAIEEAVALAETDVEIGAVQSLVKMWKEEDVLNTTGGMIHFLGFGYARDNGVRVEDAKRRDGEEIAYASGAAVLYRVSALQEVGLLDTHLFLYHEDLELGWRLRLAGYKNVLATRSVALHDYVFSKSTHKFYWMERNRLLVHLSLLKWQTLMLFLPWMVALELGLILAAVRGGWMREKLLAYWNLVHPAQWMYVWKKRRHIRLLRTVRDREVLEAFVGTIAYQEQSSLLVQIGNPLLSLVWKGMYTLIRW